jgi:thiosulfate/3-mercaptopyruvate sulfurtransferase
MVNIMSTQYLYSVQQAQKMINDGVAVAVDVRDPDAFATSHLPGAVNIPEMFYELSMSTKEGLREMEKIFIPLFSRAGLDKNKTIIVYEDSLNTRYGGSCRGFFQLTYFGYTNVGVLDGGLAQWVKDELPLTAEVAAYPPVKIVPEYNRDFFVDKQEMKDALANPWIKILDNRDADEWRGESSSPYGADFAPRKGRLPGARWIEWYDFMQSGDDIPHFHSPEKIRAICARAGLYPDDDIIVYCFKGARASNTLLALKIAGFSRVRNYYGSWNEWSRDPTLPIDQGILAA